MSKLTSSDLAEKLRDVLYALVKGITIFGDKATDRDKYIIVKSAENMLKEYDESVKIQNNNTDT